MSSLNVISEEETETLADCDEEYYNKWKSETGDVLKWLDQLRRRLDERAVQIRSDSLFENAAGVKALSSELTRVKATLRATEKYLVGDLNSSLSAVRQSLASYSEATREKLGYDSDPSAPPGTCTDLCRRVLSGLCKNFGIRGVVSIHMLQS